jgi:TolB-like protein/Tfp pilus assembly protein PilF
MEFIAGESLRDWLHPRSPLEPLMAISLARQIAQGLQAIHRENVVHRDLKPTNIMVLRADTKRKETEPEAWQIKIIDFGLAKRLLRDVAETASEAATQGFRGTALYASPEQCEERRDLDGRSDLYSLGCVMWEMLVGAPPFRANAHIALLNAHVAKPPPMQQLSHLPTSLQAVMARLMLKDRDARFADAGAVFRAFERCQARIEMGEESSEGRSDILEHETVAHAALTLARDKNVKSPTATASTDAPNEQVPSICVLPFANMSGDPEQEYFSDGITEDIITDLSRVSALSVASRNAAFNFKSKQVDITKVAKQLNVSYVLEGSVRKAGNRVRITAQLIEGSNDKPLWAERFDRDLNDIFALQDDISKAVVNALKLRLLPAEKKAIEQRSTVSPKAYELYLLARKFNTTGNSRHHPISIRLCQRAVEIDPKYASAWAMLALCQSNDVLMRGAPGDAGRFAAEQALALDPQLAEAHAAKGRILADTGRFEEALAEHLVALRINPDAYEVNVAAARCFIAMKRYDDAIRCLERAAVDNETDFWALENTIQCHEAKGDKVGAASAARRTIERVEKVIVGEPDHGMALGYGIRALVTLGQSGRAKEWTERAMIVDPDNNLLHYKLACSMIQLGEYDEALRLLGRVLGVIRRPTLVWFEIDPELDPIREDPRYKALVAQANIRLAKSD